jgi:hypothetical protein
MIPPLVSSWITTGTVVKCHLSTCGLSFHSNSAFVSRDGVMKCHLSKGGLSCQSWNEFSNAYSQNKSAEMPLVQKESNPTCPSQTPLVEEGVHRRCSQMPFAVRYVSKNYQIEIRTIQSHILPWATIRPDSKGQPTFSKPTTLWSKLIWNGSRRRPSWRGGDGPTYCWKREIVSELERKIIQTLVQLQVGTWSWSHWSICPELTDYLCTPFCWTRKAWWSDEWAGQRSSLWKLWCSKTSFQLEFNHLFRWL